MNVTEGILVITQGSEFNNDKDLKKALDTEAEKTNKKDHMEMPWMPEIPHNCIYSPNTRATTVIQNKWTPIIPSSWTGFLRCQ